MRKTKGIRNAIAMQNQQRRKRWRDRFMKRNPGYRCPGCGKSPKRRGRFPTVDHIVPLAKGGPDEPDNWQVMCNVCNNQKGDS